jgi:LytS/YehU family sensor histidine kinase
VGCLLAGLVELLLGLTSPDRYWPEFRGRLPFSAVITLTFGLSMYFYYVLRSKLEHAHLELRTRQMEEERARKLAAEARLASLEARIHPHFLFNTLNSIAALIPQDPKSAEAMVTRLASLLRFSLNAHRSRLVPLGQELAMVRHYLELEQVRFGTRLRYSLQVPEALENVGVPPLAVQSLVENSVKHVIANSPSGGDISVRATVDNGLVHLEVTDSGPGFALEAIPSGHGIHNLTDRLALVYGSRASLEVDRATVRLRVPREA